MLSPNQFEFMCTPNLCLAWVHKMWAHVKYEFTKSGKPTCDYCKWVGHIHAKCLKRQADDGNRNNQGN